MLFLLISKSFCLDNYVTCSGNSASSLPNNTNTASQRMSSQSCSVTNNIITYSIEKDAHVYLCLVSQEADSQQYTLCDSLQECGTYRIDLFDQKYAIPPGNYIVELKIDNTNKIKFTVSFRK